MSYNNIELSIIKFTDRQGYTVALQTVLHAYLVYKYCTYAYNLRK
jgi:hypothetical protein